MEHHHTVEQIQTTTEPTIPFS